MELLNAARAVEDSRGIIPGNLTHVFVRIDALDALKAAREQAERFIAEAEDSEEGIRG